MRKHWWFKHWRLDDFSPNLPMLEPSKVSLHTVYYKREQLAIVYYCMHSNNDPMTLPRHD